MAKVTKTEMSHIRSLIKGRYEITLRCFIIVEYWHSAFNFNLKNIFNDETLYQSCTQ